MAFSEELIRLATFKSWPSSSRLSPLTLAKCGFYYTGSGCKVECFKCRTRLDVSTEEEIPQDRHRQMAPHCEFLAGNCEENVPLNTGVPISSKVERTTRGQTVTDDGGFTNREPIKLIYDQALSRAKKYEVPLDMNGPTTISRNRADSAVGRREEDPDPLPNYYDWSHVANVDPVDFERDTTEQKPSATDYHPIYQRDTEVRMDTPAVIEEELSATGENFTDAASLLDTVTEQEYGDEASSMQAGAGASSLGSGVGNSSIIAAIGNYQFDQKEVEARMVTPTVGIILDMGFSRDIVKAVIEERLSTTGDDFPDAQSLLNAVLEREDEASSVHAGATASGFSSVVGNDSADDVK